MSVSTDYTNKDIFIGGQADHTHAADDTKTEDSLGKDAFLTMMVAQLKNQDPLNPMDGTDFTAQLAQFSSLEQQISTNTNLENILGALQSSSEETNLFNYMGKNVTSDGNPVAVQNGEVISGGYFGLSEPASIDVVVYNQEGAAVRVMSSGGEMLPEGSYNIEWDGTDNEGYSVLNGEYTYEVIAKNTEGAYSTVSTTSSGMVTGISSSGGNTYLVVDGGLVDPSSIETISIADGSEG